MGFVVDGAPRKAHLTVLSGPSGTGKGSVINAAVKFAAGQDVPLWLSVSDSTRQPRQGEVDGVDYNFITNEEHARRAKEGYYLEYASYVGSKYGTPAITVIEKLEAGIAVLLEIDMIGARDAQQVSRNSFGLEVLRVFLSVPTMNDLERQLIGRGTETAETIQKRMKRAEIEMASANECDVIIINRSIADSARTLLALLSR